MNAIRLLLQILVPLAVLGGGAALAKLVASKAKPPTVVDVPVPPPLVRVATATTADVRLDVTTQGTVEALRTVELSAEVGGRIVATSDALRVGSTFAHDEVLVTLDARDLDFALANQTAAVARAELRLLQEKAEAEAAVRAWRALEGDRPADPLVTRAPQIREAEAALAAAQATLAKNRLDRQRTEVRAPFAGRVRSVAADQGQNVMPGQRLAVVVDDSAVEVRLPIPVDEAAFLDLPLQAAVPYGQGPVVEITVDFAGEQHAWRGHVVRTEGEIDRRTRQLTVVARIDGARGGDGAPPRPPLLVGQFVQGRIHGRSLPAAVVVPRAALRSDGTVWIVDAEQRLRRRPVRVLRSEPDRVVLQGGLAAGERVCLSQLDTAGEGTPVTLPPPTGDATPRK